MRVCNAVVPELLLALVAYDARETLAETACGNTLQTRA